MRGWKKQPNFKTGKEQKENKVKGVCGDVLGLVLGLWVLAYLEREGERERGALESRLSLCRRWVGCGL